MHAMTSKNRQYNPNGRNHRCKQPSRSLVGLVIESRILGHFQNFKRLVQRGAGSFLVARRKGFAPLGEMLFKAAFLLFGQRQFLGLEFRDLLELFLRAAGPKTTRECQGARNYDNVKKFPAHRPSPGKLNSSVHKE